MLSSPDHVLASILLRHGQRAGPGAGLPPGGGAAADAQPWIRVILVLTLQPQPEHLFRSGDTPGGHGVLNHGNYISMMTHKGTTDL